jgi:arylsulfatase A-like enzyme
VIEWPSRIPRPRVSEVNTVTSDILPTLCELAGQPLPKRPLDGISLVALLDGKMTERPKPICFWNGRAQPSAAETAKPYIDLELQKGTTPLVKLAPEGATRNFQNYHHPDIQEQDFAGARAIVENRYKLVLNGDAQNTRELFDLRADPAEKKNLAATHPEIAANLEQQLHAWQQSVLRSLTGADYR